MNLVFDTESNGFVDEATQIHCIVTLELGSEHIRTHRSDWNNSIETGIEMLQEADTLICHNIISHDIPLIQKLYPTFKPKGTIIDTLVLSQLLYPDRPGGHGLEAWGERNNIPKPEHEDWSYFSEEMLHRCKEDVRNNYITYQKLLEEVYGDIKGIPYKEIFA